MSDRSNDATANRESEYSRRSGAKGNGGGGGASFDSFGRADPDEDRSGGLWRLPAVRNYLDRIGAEPRSIKRAWIVEGEDGYSKDVSPVDFADDGKVTTADRYAPTEQEQAAICEQAKGVVLPQQTIAPNQKPAHLFSVPEKNLFAFKNVRGEAVAWQERRETNGKRSFHFWTFYSDGRWRQLEPEGGLPLYGLEKLKELFFAGTVYLHEGAGAARAMQNIDQHHPWYDETRYSVHIGWVGGAPNPTRTDWKPLLKSQHVKRIVIVADNDDIGRSAVLKIAKIMQVPTYMIQFTTEFPPSFDLADEFPREMFGKVKTRIRVNSFGAEKEVHQYIGPSYESCLQPATWLTDIAHIDEKGRPSYKLRKSAKGLWVYVKDIDKYVCLDHPQFRYTAEALNRMLAPFADAAPMRYIKKDHSYHINGVCYQPSQQYRKIITTSGGPKLNVYRGSDIKPVTGDVNLWLAFLKQLFPIEAEREFIMRFAATLIARPEIAMKVAVLLVSKTQGTGKSTFAKILKRCIGAHNASEPNAETIVDKPYTDWLVFKRLIIVHEIYEGHSWKAYNKIKSKITEDTVEACIRYENSYDVENYATFVLCSNAYEALKIEDSDRRIFAPHVTETPMDKEVAANFYAWLDAGGYAIIRQWAIDYGSYLPNHCQVPMTSLKKDIIDSSKSKIDAYVETIAETMQQSAAPIAVGLSSVFNRAKELHPNEHGGVLSVGRILIAGGLAYLEDKLKLSGTSQRAFLNSAAAAVIEERYECRYSAIDRAFVDSQTGARLEITRISRYLNEIYKGPDDIEPW